MGRDWYWSRSVARGEGKETAGCMSGMLHLLDLQQLLSTTTSSTSRTAPHSAPPKHRGSPPDLLKGMEAPRNSLEQDEGTTSSISTIREEYYDIPFGIQLTVPSTKVAEQKSLPLEEDRRSAEAGTPRTPSLVARLMGLEVIPDQAPLPTIHCRRSHSFSAPTTPPLLDIYEHSHKMKKKKKQYVDESRRELPPPRRPLQNRNCNLPPSPQARLEAGCRSLPDTPRASSARPWDVDPRLSLQLNKENTPWATREYGYAGGELHGEYSLPHSPLPYITKCRKNDSSRRQDENKIPRNHSYASEIVEQVKESTSSRRGGFSGSEHGIRSRRTRPTEKKVSQDGGSCNQFRPTLMKPPPSCSPPSVKFLEPLEKLKSLGDENQKPPEPPKPSRPKLSTSPLSSSNQKKPKTGDKCKKPSYERFTERIKKPSQTSAVRQPEISIFEALPLPSPSMQSVKISQKQTKASCVTMNGEESITTPCTWFTPEKAHLSPLNQAKYHDPINGSEAGLNPIDTQKSHQCQKFKPKEHDHEFQYVRSILVHAGIMERSVHSFRWYSPSRPINPVIFHKLELEFPFRQQSNILEGEDHSLLSHLSHRWNRKLLFHLVQEILVDLPEWPRFNTARSLFQLHGHGPDRQCSLDGESLLQKLWSQIQKFPAADCRVVGDIDALVEGDLQEASVRRLLLHPSVVEEAEDITAEIERGIYDSLMEETAASLVT